MNWKIILQLSVFGLIMACATVSLIPQNLEPAFWVPIFIFSAYVIAKVCAGKYFLNGLCVGLANCVWIVAIHIVFAQTYVQNHLEMATKMPGMLAVHPRLGMLLVGPVVGVASGIVIGLFALVASKIMKKT